MASQKRGGAHPLADPGIATPIRIPPDLRDRAEDWGRRNQVPSFAAVVRLALQRLIETDGSTLRAEG